MRRIDEKKERKAAVRKKRKAIRCKKPAHDSKTVKGWQNDD
jgi:hypothetical protein